MTNPTFGSNAAKQRIDMILDEMQETGPMTVAQIAEAAKCSVYTARRYVAHLVDDLELVRQDGSVIDGVGQPEFTYALCEDDEPESGSGAALAVGVFGLMPVRVYSQFVRTNSTPPVIRRDPMVAAFFGGA
jgi:hypothetical protein